MRLPKSRFRSRKHPARLVVCPGMKYRLSDFDYELPPELIAQVPAATRSASRLLHVRGMHRDRSRVFATCRRCSRPAISSCSTTRRVINARVFGQKSTGGSASSSCIERVVSDARGVGAGAREPHAAAGIGARASPAARTAHGGRARRSLPSPSRSRARGRCTRGSSATAKCRCRRTSRRRAEPQRPRALPDDLRARARRRGRAHGRTALRRRRDGGARRARRRSARSSRCTWAPGTFQPVQHEELARHRMHEECVHAAAPPRSTRSRAARARGATRRRRRHHDACARSNRRRSRRAASRPGPRAPRSSSRPASASAWSIACSPTSTCRARRCSCW